MVVYANRRLWRAKSVVKKLLWLRGGSVRKVWELREPSRGGVLVSVDYFVDNSSKSVSVIEWMRAVGKGLISIWARNRRKFPNNIIKRILATCFPHLVSGLFSCALQRRCALIHFDAHCAHVNIVLSWSSSSTCYCYPLSNRIYFIRRYSLPPCFCCSSRGRQNYYYVKRKYTRKNGIICRYWWASNFGSQHIHRHSYIHIHTYTHTFW